MNENSTDLFWPNSARSIRISGGLRDNLTRRTLCRLNDLISRSQEPITLYLKSYGGFINSFKQIEELFATTDARGKKRKFVTVAIGDTGSTAAYLLVLGHYAYAIPDSRLLFHGARYKTIRPLKTISSENAMAMFASLEAQNRRIAGKLAVAMIYRVIHRYRHYRYSLRSDPRNCTSSFAALQSGYISYIRQQLYSGACKTLLMESLAQASMLFSTIKHRRPNIKATDVAKVYSSLEDTLKAIMAYQLNMHINLEKSLSNTAQCVIDFSFLHQALSLKYPAMLMDLTKAYGPYLLTDSEIIEYSKIRHRNQSSSIAFLWERAGLDICGLWHFAMALSRRLMIGENSIPATDAYWLGLIDGVTGTMLSWQPLANEQRPRY